MPDHGGNVTPSPSSKDDGVKHGRTKDDTKDGTKDGGPKTPINVKNGKKKLTQIELTPIESLLFFNIVRFNGRFGQLTFNSEPVDWGQVAAHSHLKNAASAKVRFRQILKKHGLMDQAPETPRSQAQKRKAAMKPEESQDDDEDGDSSYNPSPATAKSGVQKRSAPRAAGSRAKRTKGCLASEHDQEDEEAVADGVGFAHAPASTLDNKTVIKTEGKTDSEPGSGNAVALLNENGVAGAIDGTASASPYDQSHGQAPSPRVLVPGAAHPLDLGSHQSTLSAYMDDIQAREPQSLHPGMDPHTTNANGSFGPGQRLTPGQLAAFRACRDSQLQSHRELHANQLNRFQAPQMFPYQTLGMPGNNFPFAHISNMQFEQHFPVDAYNGVTFFDQAQFGYEVADDEGVPSRVDGQDEWDLDNGIVKREATPEVERPAEAEWERKDGDDYMLEDKP